MAVTKLQLEARLRLKYPKANLSKERINEFSDRLSPIPKDGATDEEIDAVLDQSNTYMPFEEIAKNDDKLRSMKKQIDETKTPAEIEAERIAKEKSDAKEKAENEAKDKAPEWFKPFAEKLETMDGRFVDFDKNLTGMKKDTDITLRKEQAKALFEGDETLKGMDEGIRSTWLNTRIDYTSETPLEDQVKSLSSEYSSFTQSSADGKTLSGPPGVNVSTVKPADDVVKDIAKSM
jgi:hypothetical protein